ncbi:MAG: hypothetical protein ACLRWM_01750 [Streptococcus sp.]
MAGKLFDEHTLLEEYDHIFYNEIAGYCKCLEDMGFIENVEVKLDIESELKKLQAFQRVLMKSRQRPQCWKILQKCRNSFY